MLTRPLITKLDMTNLPKNINEHCGRLNLHCLLVGSFFAITFLFTGRGSTDQGLKYPSTPEEVIQVFCQLDKKGNRLSSETWQGVLPLVTWSEEITAGELNKVIHIISGFKIGESTILNSTARVSVEYRYLGSTDTLEFSEPKEKRRTIIFELIKQNGSWKIQNPILAPHVDLEAGIGYLKLLQKRKPHRKEQLEVIIKKITEAARTINAK